MEAMEEMPIPAPPLAIEQATPMMRQYLELKAKFPDAILFFRLGDFYEMFFEDAVRAAELLQITLTSRAKGDGRVPMCGVPHHAAKAYIAKLIEAGNKVAICDQLEEAGAGKTIVRREVTRIVTPGMVLDDDLLDARREHFLAAICGAGTTFGLALLDASTGVFRAGQVGTIAQLTDELLCAEPREVIVPAGSAELLAAARRIPRAVVHEHEPRSFDPARADASLRRQLGVATLASFGLGSKRQAIAAAGAAIGYLTETQRGPVASHVDRLEVMHPERHLVLDEATRRNLELTRTLSGEKQGSLLSLLDKTSTSLGARTLARWLSQPLVELEPLARRHDAVEELASRAVLRTELMGVFREVSDLERLLGRLSLRAGNARDLLALGRSLGRLPALRELLASCATTQLRELVPSLEGLDATAKRLVEAIAEDAPVTLTDGGLFRRGYDPQLDELLTLAGSGKETLARLEAQERARTGISSLKLRYNKVFGYYLEVTRANLQHVPGDYVRKQTTANAERFVTEELKRYEEQILTAEERRITLEKRLFDELCAQVLDLAPAIKAAAASIGVADCLLSLARVASDYGYVRPELDEGDVLELVEARHPIVERAIDAEAFVPNDLRLDRTERQLLVVTGPNMAGKSTVLRQTALIALLAQVGSFVPATRARIGLVDRIFCRVGASDDLARGQSTFMVEMVETAAILHGATARSLVILDEIGRGTSTFDGLSIAWAVAEHLHDVSGARALFATHYHELIELEREKPRVKNATIAVTEQAGGVVFLRKLVDGGASRSYGIEVARLAGLPTEVLRRAREILRNLEQAELDPEGRAVFAAHGRVASTPAPQLSLFGAAVEPLENELLARLREVELEKTTPFDALLLLQELQARARELSSR